MLKIEKLFSSTLRLGENGLKSASIFPGDLKIKLRIDSIHIFKKITI
jgi:hypothetical protein